MKTKELIEKVKELGYYIRIGEITVFISNAWDTLVTIDRNKPYLMSTYSIRNACNAGELFDLCAAYARTPIEEREEEKKYYLRKIKSFYEAYLDEKYNFLKFKLDGNYFCLHNTDETYNFKAQFTKKEIDAIKKKYNTDLEEFEQIEVDSDEV